MITYTFYSCYYWNPSFSLKAAFNVEYKSVIFQQGTSSAGSVPAWSVNMSRHEVIPALHSWRGRKWHQLQFLTLLQNCLAKLLAVVVFHTKRNISFVLKLLRKTTRYISQNYTTPCFLKNLYCLLVLADEFPFSKTIIMQITRYQYSV